MHGQRNPNVTRALVLQLTLTCLFLVVAPVLLGFWLDHALHTSPFITLIFTVFGIAFGSFAVLRAITNVYKSFEGDKSE